MRRISRGWRTAAVLLVLCVVATGCIKPVRAGARCSTAEWGQDRADFVLKCERGRWVRKATVAQVAQLYVAILASKTTTSRLPTTVSSPPTTTPIPISPAAGVTVGYGTSCGWLVNTRIKCWGDNSEGALAIGNTTPYLIPITPIFGPRGTDLAIGTGHVCALEADRSMICWGKNNQAQLGNTVGGTPQPVPANVGGLADVTTVAAGDEFTCVTLTSGNLVCWGNNVQRPLGISNVLETVLLRTAVADIGTVPPNAVSAKRTVAGFKSQCVLMTAGVVWCVGDNSLGQLGRNLTSTNASAFGQVGGINTAVDIAAGKEHYCALLANGTLSCWGSNASGQLGLPLTTPFSKIPVPDVAGFTNIAQVTANEVSTCVRRTDGTVQCIGMGADGALGNGSWGNSLIPVAVAGISDAVALSSGGRTSCAVRRSGEIWCWGQNDHGQLGNVSTTNSNVPVNVTGFPF